MAEPEDDEPVEGADIKKPDDVKKPDDRDTKDGVPRTYASESKEGSEKTSYGGQQGGD